MTRHRDLEADLHLTSAVRPPCAHGCTIRGQHKPTDAEGNPQCPAQKPVADGEEPKDCTGCLPRPATNGQLCPWCWQRLHADVVDIPHLVRHLRRLGYPDAGRNPDATGRGGDPAMRIPYPPEWDTADELANALTGWLRVILDKHPAHLTGPDEAGIWWTRQTLREGHVEQRRPAGLRTVNVLDGVVRWLLPHLPWVAEQDWVAEMRGDLASQVSTARARWPLEERGHAVEHIPCPRCDQATLWYTPPTEQRPTMQVACTNPDCGRVFTEDEWDRMRALVRLAADRRLLA